MKYTFLFAVMVLLLWNGCSSEIDTIDMGAKERFDYAMTLYEEEDYLEVIQELETLLLQYPGSEVADDATFYLGMTRFQREEFLLAAYEFSKLIRNMPASSFISESQFMLGESYYRLSPPYPLDQEYSKRAIREFQAFIDFFPTDSRIIQAEEKIQELNNKLAQKQYQSAIIYEKMEYYNAALLYFQDVTETYHDTPFAPEAAFERIQLLIRREEYNKALNEMDTFLNRYPDDEHVEEIEIMKDELQTDLLSADG